MNCYSAPLCFRITFCVTIDNYNTIKKQLSWDLNLGIRSHKQFSEPFYTLNYTILPP